MFRAQANTFDDAVAKATDENLTSENWAYILDVCDRVSTSPQGPSSATAALIKRFAHRNANVQLYTLELANALSQNCGAPIHRELASRSFTDALLRLANDRNTHQQVKGKVLERMQEWTDMFTGNPDLGIMAQAYEKLRQGNPGLVAPSKPVKREIEAGDRKKEDEELQMALALSLREKAATPSAGHSAGPAELDTPSGAQAGTTAATVSRVRALYDFTPSEPGELAFRKNDIIAVLESVYKDWWKGSLRGQTGIFPLNYVEKLQDPTKDELEKDATMEGEVFAQIRNVEKLLALLSVRGEGGIVGSKNDGSEEEITELYHQTLAIRPKLIELIGKYSQKKDDFTQLNEKFIKARRDYEALLEASMSQPPAVYGARQPSQQYYNAYGPPQGYPPQPPQQQPSYQQQGQGPPQDYQRYYNPPPSEAPAGANYGYPPPNANSGTPAPFHFLPSGGAPQQPPDARNHTPKPHNQPDQHQQQYASHPPQQQFANRPQSIHTLNSGQPSELASGGYDSSPIDSRPQYPPSNGAPPPPAQNQNQSQNQTSYPDHAYPDSAGKPTHPLPLRQRRQSEYESPTSVYSVQTPGQDGPYPVLQGQGQGAPSHAPPQVPQPQSPVHAYQAYNPGFAPPQAQAQGGVGGGGADDASDYYR